MLKYIVLIGALVQLFGTGVYIRETLKGNTKPNRVSWLMWAIAPLIATAASLMDGVQWAVLPVFMVGFGPLLVLIASAKSPKAYWKLEKFDYICGVFAIFALILWGITRDPFIAVVFAIISDIFAAIPTIKKCFTHPETESIAAYTTAIFNAGTSFFAFQTFTATEVAFPLYLVILNALIVIVFYKGKLNNR